MATKAKINLTTNQLNSLNDIATNSKVKLHHTIEKALLTNGLITKDSDSNFFVTSQGKKYLESKKAQTKKVGKIDLTSFEKPVMITHCDLVPDPDQPRQYYSPQGLFDLVASIMQVGYLNNKTLIVTPINDGKYKGKYKVIAGNRRVIASAWAFQYLNQGYKYDEIPYDFTDEKLDKLILKYDHPDYPHHSDLELPCFVIPDSDDVDLIAFLDNLNYEAMPELDQAVFLRKKLDKEYLERAKAIYKLDTAKRQHEIAKYVSRKNTKQFNELLNATDPKLLAYHLLKADFGYSNVSSLEKLISLAYYPSTYHKDIKTGCYNKHIVKAIANKIVEAKLENDPDTLAILIDQGLLKGCKINKKTEKLTPLDITATQAQAKITELYNSLTNNIELKQPNIDVLPDSLKDIACYCKGNGINAIGKLLRENADYIDKDQLDKFAIAASKLTYEKDDEKINHTLYSRSEITKLINDKFREFMDKLNDDEIDRDSLESQSKDTDHPNNTRDDQISQEIVYCYTTFVNQHSGIQSNVLDIEPNTLAKIYKNLDKIMTQVTAIKKTISKQRPEVLETAK